MSAPQVVRPWEAPTRRRIHVLHVVTPTSGTTARAVIAQVREQLGRGWNVTVACPSDGWLGFTVRQLGGRTRWWGARREPGRGTLGERAALGEIVEGTRPDVVHLHGAKAGLVGRLVVRGSVPTIFQPHGWSFLSATGRTRRGALLWERFASRWTDEVICVSEAERDLGASVGVSAPSTVLPYGLDDDEPALAEPEDPAADAQERRERARTALGLPAVPTAVCAGRLTDQKGLDVLLAAWPGVLAQVPDAQLLLVGDGPSRPAIEERAAGLDGVRLVGARNDVPVWMTAAHVVVSVTRWRLSLTVLEAMAQARSVIATDVVGMRETIPPEAGAIVPVGDVGALTEALVQRLRYWGEADDEGEVGLAGLSGRDDARAVADQVSGLYLRLLASRRQHRVG